MRNGNFILSTPRCRASIVLLQAESALSITILHLTPLGALEDSTPAVQRNIWLMTKHCVYVQFPDSLPI